MGTSYRRYRMGLRSYYSDGHRNAHSASYLRYLPYGDDWVYPTHVAYTRQEF
jgi:hypothetical protein